MNCRKLIESKKLTVTPMRRNLSQIISESYGLLYSTNNPKIKKLVESLIEDIRKDALKTDELSYNLQCIRTLAESNVAISLKDIKLTEDEDLDDPRLETDDATVDPMTAVNPVPDEEPDHDAPKADPDEVVKFAENSRNKSFYRALSKVSSLNESTKRFDLTETLNTYKAANSAMTQMAIEYEHNPSFKETFTVLTSVLGKATRSILESIYAGAPITEKAGEIVSRFSKVICEDEQEDVDDFIDWVSDEYQDDDEEGTTEETSEEDVEVEIPDDLTVDQAKDVIDDVIDTALPDGAPDDEEMSVEDEVAELSEEEEEEVKSFLCILRGCEPDSEEANAEPTEEELDALESRILTLRKKKECDEPKVKKESRTRGRTTRRPTGRSTSTGRRLKESASFKYAGRRLKESASSQKRTVRRK